MVVLGRVARKASLVRVILEQDSQGSEVKAMQVSAGERSRRREPIGYKGFALDGLAVWRRQHGGWSRGESRREGETGDQSGPVAMECHEKPLESFEQRSDVIWLLLEKETLCYIGNSKYVGVGRRVEGGRPIKGM